MIIYGSKAVHLKSEQSVTATCPSCKTQGSVVISVYRKHAHIFWIPLFPIGKVGLSQCQHCKSVLKTKEMPDSIKSEYNVLKEQTKGPLWQFIGLGLIAFLIIWGSFANSNDKKQELEYISSPKAGDIYEYKIEAGKYSTIKVVDASKDSVFVIYNDYELNLMSQLYKIEKPENYSGAPCGISRNKLKEMYVSGEIFDIKR
jgi:hypothetical protein